MTGRRPAIPLAEPILARASLRRRARRTASLSRIVAGTSGLICFFLVAPLLIVIPLSFSSATYLQFPPPGWSLRWYHAYVDSPAWMGATATTLEVACGTTVLATLLGTLLAFSLVRGRYPGKTLVGALAAAPIIVPNMVTAVAIYGVFARLQLIGQWYGVAIGHTIYAIPFVVLVVAPALRTFDEDQERAAMGLGAGRLRAIWHVTLPQIRPALISAAFLAFISSFDELVIALFLSGSNATLPKKMFESVVFEIDPTIAAVSVLQILLVAIVIGAAARFGAVPRLTP
jgi:putative spermidine/putrescine transport system permease protein